MALSTKVKEVLYGMHAYRAGRIPVEGIQGLVRAIERVQGQGVKVPDIQIKALTQVGTTVNDVFLGVGRVYGLIVISPPTATKAALIFGEFRVPADTIDVAVVAEATKIAQVYYFGGFDGIGTVGEHFAVLAFHRASQAIVVQAEKPDVIVIYGLDDTNTDSENFTNLSYG